MMNKINKTINRLIRKKIERTQITNNRNEKEDATIYPIEIKGIIRNIIKNSMPTNLKT